MTLLKKECLFCKQEFSFKYQARKTRKYCSNTCCRKDNAPLLTDPIIILKKNIVVDEITGCWLYQKLHIKGYGHLYVNGKKYPAHRFSYEYHHQQINNSLLYVCHKCDIRNCVNPDHLFLGTAKENNMDKIIKNRGKYKLTLGQVKEIKHKIKMNIPVHIIAKEYSVHRETIGKIKREESYAYV